ncbi:hypothetical protein JCM31826_09160 [Thermaurantimonas aggregans]|uniref:Haloacid dehalogenase n=1 Tax=Thermaurantimonas aggregans TaxID=2173829 RepID=A0A401XKC4_9FLAO|nr:HAD family phosphatase [Thermaurantimonas aggregans]MCX8148376.1 HAD family phosphatase [Thermaurantimonas aggregans]GCD77434.1 hypothetical protein JCM31826_09160 [Thermaurantimonas aggregans]
MKEIKNIIWDFGIVLIDLNMEHFHQQCQAHGIKSNINILSTHFSHTYEKGLISEHEFFREAKLLFPRWVSYPTIKAIWNSMLGHIPDEKIRLLHKIRKAGYAQVLCSNTNPTHIRHIWQSHGPYTTQRFKKAFQQLYLSYEYNLRKPEPEFFNLIIDQMGWLSSETLLIDDNEHNIDAASSLGMHVLHYTGEESLKYFDTALPKLHAHRAGAQSK